MRLRVLPLLLVLALAAVACSSDSTTDNSTRDDEGSIVEGGDVGVFVLAIGDCFDDPTDPDAPIAAVAAVPCDEPHDNQVAAKFDLADGDWPGLTGIQTDAMRGCIDRFEAATGEAYETSPLDVFPLYPTEDSWKAGDHEVVCSVYNLDLSKLTADVIA